MSPVTLYYHPFACSLGVHVALKLAKVDYNLVKVDIKTKKTEDGDDYYKISASGAVPTLKLENGEILTQNAAILTYIGDISNYPSFKQETALEKARYLEAIGFNYDLHIAVGLFAFFNGDESQYKRRLNELEAGLPATGYWLGTKEPSQADIYTAVVLNWVILSKHSLDAWPKAKALHKTVFELEAVQEALKEQ